MDTDYLYEQLVAFAKHEDCYPLDRCGSTFLGSIPPKGRVSIVTLRNNSACSLVFCQFTGGGALQNEGPVADQIEKNVYSVWQNLFERTKLHVSFVDFVLPADTRDYVAVSFYSNPIEKPYEISTKGSKEGAKT